MPVSLRAKETGSPKDVRVRIAGAAAVSADQFEKQFPSG
jgi:hypothetical protein